MRKLIVIKIVLVSVFLFRVTALAETSIKAEVDKTNIATDETLTYKLTITSSKRQIPNPELPKFEGFSIISSAQSSTVSFDKDNINTVLAYTFILAPTNIGKFKIEPSVVKIENEVYSTDAFEIEVSQAKARPKALPEQKPSLPKRTQPESEQFQITL